MISSSPTIKPCPFCGETLPIKHISFSCVVLECNCGATLRDGAARTMYLRDELPLDLQPYSYEPTALVVRGEDGIERKHPEHGYVAVNALGALEHSGALAKWNARAGDAA